MAVRTTTLLLCAFALSVTSSILLSILLLVRLQAILPPYRNAPQKRRRGSPTHLMVVLGSGGHTAEMLEMLRDLDPSAYNRRSWIVSAGDSMSAIKAEKFEKMLEALARDTRPHQEYRTYTITTLPRARKIHQSLLTTPVSALYCLLACLRLLYNNKYGYPDLIVTNGPATGCILVFASVLLRFFDAKKAHTDGKMRTIYVESWARVKRLSLTGWLLQLVVDRLGVQWKELKGGRAEYMGWLVL